MKRGRKPTKCNICQRGKNDIGTQNRILTWIDHSEEEDIVIGNACIECIPIINKTFINNKFVEKQSIKRKTNG